MKSWPALIIAPLLALTSIGIGYALVPWVCSQQRPLVLHATTLVFLVVTLALGLLSWMEWRRTGPGYGADRGDEGQRAGFLSLLAMSSGAFFSLVILAQWITQWFIPACQF
jgi:hypothetical protein